MGKKVNPQLKIMQRGIGFNFYQMVFFSRNPDFKPDEYCRKAIDEQIERIDPELWEEVKELK